MNNISYTTLFILKEYLILFLLIYSQRIFNNALHEIFRRSLPFFVYTLYILVKRQAAVLVRVKIPHTHVYILHISFFFLITCIIARVGGYYHFIFYSITHSSIYTAISYFSTYIENTLFLFITYVPLLHTCRYFWPHLSFCILLFASTQDTKYLSLIKSSLKALFILNRVDIYISKIFLHTRLTRRISKTLI